MWLATIFVEFRMWQSMTQADALRLSSHNDGADLSHWSANHFRSFSKRDTRCSHIFLAQTMIIDPTAPSVNLCPDPRHPTILTHRLHDWIPKTIHFTSTFHPFFPPAPTSTTMVNHAHTHIHLLTQREVMDFIRRYLRRINHPMITTRTHH